MLSVFHFLDDARLSVVCLRALVTESICVFLDLVNAFVLLVRARVTLSL